MRFVVAVAIALLPACNCNNNAAKPDGAPCFPPRPCESDEVCRFDTCVPEPTSCTSSADCKNDNYCELGTMECIPWGVGPGGASDMECKREPVPGVFFPGAQCEWTAPPAGDAYPDHKNVLATPMVATFYKNGEFPVPSIVFTSYNFDDGGAQSCMSSEPASYYGVIRIIDGRSCQQQATIASPTLVASASVAIGDLGGDPTPEIVAARSDGGLVAFTLGPTGWTIFWQTTSQFADTLCNWAGPSIHDIDDDGKPEVLFYGAVYDGQTGATIDESIAATVDSVGNGFLPTAADVDNDGVVELITGSQLYSWNTTTRTWTLKQALPGANFGHTAVADFGTFPQALGSDDRGTKDGIAEIAVVYATTAAPANGLVKVFNVFGREIFAGALVARPVGETRIGRGGPPTIADFDGDGRVEFASAGASAYNVFDLDCMGTPDPAFCPSMATDGLAWVQQSQDFSSNLTGSTVFDFDGDDRAEVVYGDECFTRVYDGITGKVLYSRYRTSCTWYEMPVIADTDSDYNAEIVSTSNGNCNVVCPAVDPIFDGVQCLDDSDCPANAPCGREAASDALGRCRCTVDDDCGGDGFVCLDPIAGVSAAGKVCRASHPPGDLQGIRVLADTVDRWVATRAIWNQHNYSVTNVDVTGAIPKTSAWLENWTQAGLNNYRQNSPGDGQTAGAIPDLTVKQVKVTCDATGAVITAEVCNRGTEPVAPGLPVAVYAEPSTLQCMAMTSERVIPGNCVLATCTWTGGDGMGHVTVDDRGNAGGVNLECREDNNTLGFTVSCP